MEKLTKSVFVTGATGFIGRRLVAHLQALGAEVTALVLPSEIAQAPSDLRVVPGDVTDAASVSALLADVNPTLIVHLAAIGITNPGLPFSEACRVNVGGTLNILEAARSLDTLQRLVLVGSSYEYGGRHTQEGLDPFNAYSASKVAAWAYARAAFNAWGTPVVWVRPFQAYGPGQRARAFIPAAIRAALAGQDFKMTAGKQQRDFIFVDDVIAGLMSAATAPGIEGLSIDLGSGVLTSLDEVVARIWELTHADGRMLIGALPYRPGEVTAIPAAVERTLRLAGWQAEVSLQQGLALTIAALRPGAQ